MIPDLLKLFDQGVEAPTSRQLRQVFPTSGRAQPIHSHLGARQSRPTKEFSMQIRLDDHACMALDLDDERWRLPVPEAGSGGPSRLAPVTGMLSSVREKIRIMSPSRRAAAVMEM